VYVNTELCVCVRVCVCVSARVCVPPGIFMSDLEKMPRQSFNSLQEDTKSSLNKLFNPEKNNTHCESAGVT